MSLLISLIALAVSIIGILIMFMLLCLFSSALNRTVDFEISKALTEMKNEITKKEKEK